MVPQLSRTMHHCNWETVNFTFLGACISTVMQTHSITQRQPLAPQESCIINPHTRGDYLQTQGTRALLFQPAKNAIFAERVPAGFHSCSETPWNCVQACAERCRRRVSHATSKRPGMRTSKPYRRHAHMEQGSPSRSGESSPVRSITHASDLFAAPAVQLPSLHRGATFVAAHTPRPGSQTWAGRLLIPRPLFVRCPCR